MKIIKLIWKYAQYSTFCNVCYELNIKPRSFEMFLEAKEDE